MKKQVIEQRGLTKYDRYGVYFTGSHFTRTRTIYIDGQGKLWIEWYGQIIEIEEADEYRTVEKY